MTDLSADLRNGFDALAQAVDSNWPDHAIRDVVIHLEKQLTELKRTLADNDAESFWRDKYTDGTYDSS